MSQTFKEKPLKEVFAEIEKALNTNPAPYEGQSIVYQYDLSGNEEATYQLHLKDNKARVVEGTDGEADCTLKLSDSNFKDMILGNLNGTAAFMTGKLKIQGNIGLAMKMESILRQYDTSQYA